MTYHLESFDVGTIFDPPVEVLTVPAELDQIPAAVFVTEGILRPSGAFARFRSNRARLAIRLEVPSQPVRLIIRLLCDSRTAALWNRFNLPEGEEPISDVGKHRTIAVSVQGRRRSVAVFQRQGRSDKHRHRVVVDLSPEEIDPEGVLFVDFEDVAAPWALDSAMPDGMTGIGVHSLTLKEQPPAKLVPILSGVRRTDEATVLPLEPGFLGVNPGAGGGPIELSFADLPTGRSLVARVRSRLDRAETEDLQVETATLTGEREILAAERRGPGRWLVRLPASDEPRLVRPTLPGPWQVSATACD